MSSVPTVNGLVRLVVCDMEWNIEKTALFIEDYHNSPELWNNKSSFKDNKLKNDKLKQLASKNDCSVLKIKKKIKNLRTAFHRERKKLQKLKKSDSSPKKKNGLPMMNFLLDVDVPRKTISTTLVFFSFFLSLNAITKYAPAATVFKDMTHDTNVAPMKLV